MNEQELIDKLINKSIEAFLLAIEIFNKPTIAYRVEGFSFFICNAWELLLKARIAKKDGLKSIYYKDDLDRTLSLNSCIKKIFTNDKDPLRENLEKIIELRNIATHYVTEEYEQICAPLFQAAVINYCDKLMDFFDLDITNKISANFLMLSMKVSPIDHQEIQARYPESISEKLIDLFSQIENARREIADDRFAILIHHDFYLTNDRKNATAEIAVTKEATKAAFFINNPKDGQKTCPHTAKRFISIINRWIKRDKLNFINPKAHTENKRHIFNMYCFQAFVKFYALKNNLKYCYEYNVMSHPTYSYSEVALHFVYDKIKANPENVMRILYEKIEMPTPGAKDSK